MVKHRNSLGERTIKGGFWLFSLRIVTRVFLLMRTIILARLLSPNDFGLFGIALLALSCLGTFSQTGFKQAFIQKKGDTELYVNIAWTVQLIRGFLIAFILFFIAPYVATFFEVPKAESILRIIGFSIILQGLINPVAIYFEKDLKFHKYFVYQFWGAIADVCVAISAAIILRSVWALVFGLLAGNFVRCIVSYIIEPYMPCIEWDFQKIKVLFGFGKWILGSSIVVFFATQGDDLFLSKVLGITALGFYQMAFRIANLPSSEIGILSRVAFPAYSKLQDNIPKLKDAYLKMLRLFTFSTMPLASGIFILAPQFTFIFLGDKWMPMVPALRILAISSLIREIIGTSGPLFNARGRPDIDFKMNLIRVITLAAAIYPLTLLWRMEGTATAVLLAICASLPISILGSIKLSNVKIKDYMKIIFPPLLAISTMCAGITALGLFLNQFQLIGFFASIFVGIIIYLSSVFFVQKWTDYPVFEDLRFIFNSLKSKC